MCVPCLWRIDTELAPARAREVEFDLFDTQDSTEQKGLSLKKTFKHCGQISR